MTQKELMQDGVAGEIIDDIDSLSRFSTDASIFEVLPSAILVPNNLDDLRNAVKKVASLKRNGHNISLTARSGGTCMSGGSLTSSVVVDMTKHFGGVHNVDTRRKQISVGGGAYYRDVESETSRHNLLFPSYPSSKDICGIGGMIGNNASGEKSLRYGATSNWIQTLYMVLDDGQEYEFGPLDQKELDAKKALTNREGDIYRAVTSLLDTNWDLIQGARPQTRKNAAGYGLWRIWNQDKTEFNLAQLFIGAQGTLGISSGATLKLIDSPHSTRMVVVAIDSLTQLASALQLILAERPEGLEVYDRLTYELAKQKMPKVAGLAAAAEGQQMTLFAQFAEHTTDQTNHNARVCYLALRKKGFKARYIEDQAEADAHWQIRRSSYSLLKSQTHNERRAVPCIEDTVVNTTHFSEYIAALQTILNDYGLEYAYHGHIGDGSIRPFPLVDMTADGAAQQIFGLSRRVYDLAFAFNGSMSVDHNDGLIRSPFLPSMYGERVCALFEQVKQIFDPLNIFNPGKKVYSSLEYSMNHLSRTNTPPQ